MLSVFRQLGDCYLRCSLPRGAHGVDWPRWCGGACTGWMLRRQGEVHWAWSADLVVENRGESSIFTHFWGFPRKEIWEFHFFDENRAGFIYGIVFFDILWFCCLNLDSDVTEAAWKAWPVFIPFESCLPSCSHHYPQSGVHQELHEPDWSSHLCLLYLIPRLQNNTIYMSQLAVQCDLLLFAKFARWTRNSSHLSCWERF